MNPYAERPNPHWPTAAEVRQQIKEAERQLQALYVAEGEPQACHDPVPSVRLLELRIQGLYATLGEIEPAASPVAGPHADFAPLDLPLRRASWGLRTLQVALAVAACVLIVMQCTGTL